MKFIVIGPRPFGWALASEIDTTWHEVIGVGQRHAEGGNIKDKISYPRSWQQRVSSQLKSLPVGEHRWAVVCNRKRGDNIADDRRAEEEARRWNVSQNFASTLHDNVLEVGYWARSFRPWEGVGRTLAFKLSNHHYINLFEVRSPTVSQKSRSPIFHRKDRQRIGLNKKQQHHPSPPSSPIEKQNCLELWRRGDELWSHQWYQPRNPTTSSWLRSQKRYLEIRRTAEINGKLVGVETCPTFLLNTWSCLNRLSKLCNSILSGVAFIIL